jgi:putative ABC transport system permease protein
VDALRTTPGVAHAAGNRLADWTFRGEPVTLNAFDPAYFAGAAFDKPPLVGRHAPDAWEAVGRGEAVVVSTNFLLNFGVRVGDRIEVATPSGPLVLPVAGATLAFVSPGGTIEMSRALYAERWRDTQVNRVWVRRDSATAPAAVREAIARGPGAAYGARAAPAGEMRAYLVAQARRAFAPLAVVEAVVLLVALLSMSDALAAGVLRRLRELGTLRAIGVRRRHVVGIVVAEAALVGALGLVLALAAGAALGVLWIRLVLPHLLGWLLALHPPYARAAAVLAATALVCLLAAVLPARRAARLEPATALRYE